MLTEAKDGEDDGYNGRRVHVRPGRQHNVLSLHHTVNDVRQNKELVRITNKTKLFPLGFNGCKEAVCPKDGKRGCSIVHTLEPKSRGKATHYVSWVWKYPLGVVFRALRRAFPDKDKKPYPWLCFFQNNQHRIIVSGNVVGADELGHIFRSRLKRLGKIVVIFNDYEHSLYVNRVWCIYEVAQSVDLDLELKITLPDASVRKLTAALGKGINQIMNAVKMIDCEQAVAWSPEDERRIKEDITNSDGGFKLVNVTVKKALTKGLSDIFSEIMIKACT